MRNGPEQEKYRKSAGDGTHEIDGTGGGMGVVTKEYDKKPAQQNEQGCTGWMRDLEFVTAGDKLATIPETAGRLHGQHIYGAGNKPDDPAREEVEALEATLLKIHMNKLCQ